MQYESRAFLREFDGRPGMQHRFLNSLLLMHASITDGLMPPPNFEGTTPEDETRRRTAEAIAEVVDTFIEIFPGSANGDAHLARIAQDVVDRVAVE